MCKHSLSKSIFYGKLFYFIFMRQIKNFFTFVILFLSFVLNFPNLFFALDNCKLSNFTEKRGNNHYAKKINDRNLGLIKIHIK